ncbi:acetyl-CoA hydrolase/transferase family protein [Enterocloster aldensis]|jgi:4-hydroxybutyrate CoA-transferase|uniref:Acetyl-CoA hydrolase/transferase family protein n=2 Tax=Enterocloster aldenensis TaxID=358742 RepID=A0AAW5C8C3_9FIRM|nr:acetyl-CoA hydrolase/transferase C-terminal domain-containing protein [uncultured Lachnoclostridium sp.]MBE7726878.1 acetyl-CoA hydrolase/transferase family protein [Enterocloster citroniae]MBS1460787.1 acetyl-CoA hydrolase/transferase family protein [Clostridium sp.]MBS5631031.1 acetyl-CoA hydrolase/transferase family protein [Clostridiales bacterium]MCC3398427.1 acetyl-CoA hydrolase/transferase family protein [Clostridiales bacterium AHG0011]MCG4748771.1 acetyl-CoA hydrolase/transferase f
MNMDWKEKYADKIYTAAQAVAKVESGEKIIFGDWVSEPPALVEALVNRADELKGVEIIHGMSPGPNAYVAPEYQGIFHHTSLFIGPKTRKAYAEKRIDYIGGTTFSRWPDLFAKNPDLNPHWAFIQVSEPDEEGMCSFGNACCFSEPAARTADRIIAQINPKMPTLGGKKISLDKIDYIVPAESGLYTIGRAEIDARTQTIADYVAELVEDGATIQLGIGALPDAIARNLMDKKDLGVHSETLTEAMMELVQAGVINNSKKTLNPGICIGAQAAGSEKFYEFIDHHPLFAVYPVDYVNNPYVVGQNYKQTSINSCMEVDLKGQVNSETVGGRQYSGIGGQLDHVRGAQLSEGGKSILALNSTAKQDTISKIVPYFAPGNVTTISRYDVHYIVTEYGVADLKYKTERQRALALISIAHPKFRDELKFKAAEMGIL